MNLLILTFAGVWCFRGCSLPWSVPVVGKAGSAVITCGAMLAQTDHWAVRFFCVLWNANVGMAIAFASTSNYEVGYSIVV